VAGQHQGQKLVADFAVGQRLAVLAARLQQQGLLKLDCSQLPPIDNKPFGETAGLITEVLAPTRTT
jgi:hypothetical protein